MWVLDWLKIVESLSDSDKEDLETFCQYRELSSWDLLFSQWDEANAMYFLKKGAIRIYKDDLWDEKELWVVKAEEILWEMALFWWTWKRMASAKAIENTQLVTILSFSIKEMAKKYPHLMTKIQNVIEERNMSNKVLDNFS